MRKDQSLFRQVGLSIICAGLMASGCAQKADETASSDKAPAAPAKPQAAMPAADPAKVLIQINDKTLTEGDLTKQADEQYQQVASMVPPEQAVTYRSQMRVQAAQSFIVTTLLQNESVKRGITVTDADIEKAIAEITKRLPPDMTLEKVLETEDMTPVVFRDRLKKDLPVKKLFDLEIGDIPEAEVAAFYEKQKTSFEEPEQVTARHILIKVDEKDDAAAKTAKKAKIDELRKQLETGADFSTLALANSECPSAKEGGLLPKFSKGQMVPAFEEAAFTQPTNTIGPVVETQFGYHIIKVIDKTTGRVLPLSEVKDKIVDYLKMMKSRAIIPPFIEKLRAEAKVIVDPALEKEIKDQKLADEARQAADMSEEGDDAEGPGAPEASAVPAVPEEAAAVPAAPEAPVAPATPVAPVAPAK
jgi:parvulin-like peptidyl-prolyl isomerase